MEKFNKLEDLMNFLHDRMEEQMLDIDRVCNILGIDYSLYAGTLLGAVRHNDFIPWDDDADIIMTRENYEIFDKHYNDLKNNKYIYKYDGIWVKRVSERVSIQFQGQTIENISTDIFILDRAPKSSLKFKIQLIQLKALQGMIKSKVNYKNKTLIQNLLQFVTHYAGKLFTYDKKLEMYEKVSKKNEGCSDYDFFGSNLEYKHLNNYFKKELLDNYSPVNFKNSRFKILDGFDEMLKQVYGEDYLIPPPEAERIPQHLIKNNR